MNKVRDMHQSLGDQEAFPVHGLVCCAQGQGTAKKTTTAPI